MYVKVRAQKTSSAGRATDFRVHDNDVQVEVIQGTNSLQLNAKASKRTGGYFNADTNYQCDIIISAELVKKMIFALADEDNAGGLVNFSDDEKAKLLKLLASTFQVESDAASMAFR